MAAMRRHTWEWDSWLCASDATALPTPVPVQQPNVFFSATGWWRGGYRLGLNNKVAVLKFLSRQDEDLLAAVSLLIWLECRVPEGSVGELHLVVHNHVFSDCLVSEVAIRSSAVCYHRGTCP
jgi:hypothetical protein